MDSNEIRLTPGWKELFRSLSRHEIESLFTLFEQNEYRKIVGTTTIESLTDIRARLKLLSELENFFLTASKGNPNERQNVEDES